MIDGNNINRPYKNVYLLIGLLIIWTSMEDFIGTIFWQYLSFPLPVLRGISNAKELVVILLIALLILIRGAFPWRNENKLILLYLFLIVFHALFGIVVQDSFSTITILQSVKQLVSPMLYLTLGLLVIQDYKASKVIFRSIILVSILAVVTAILEIVLSSQVFWGQLIRMAEYKIHIRGISNLDSEALNNLLSTNRVFGATRIKSFYSHPNMLAYFISIVSILLLVHYSDYCKKFRLRFLYIIIFSASVAVLILTLSRGGMLIFGTSILIFTLFNKKSKSVFLLLSAGTIFLLFLPMILDTLSITSNAFVSGTEYSRMDSMIRGLQYTFSGPFGSGVGYGTSAAWASEGREMQVHNMYLLVSSQLGIVGIILFISILIALSPWKFYKNTNNYDKYTATIGKSITLTIPGLLCTGLFTNTMLVSESLYFYWFLIGYLSNKYINIRNREVKPAPIVSLS